MLEIADLSRTIMGLGVVLLLIVAVLWLVRRFGPQGVVGAKPTGRLALVESLTIDPRTRLVLVRQDDREHLLAITASGGATVVRSSDEAIAAVRPVGGAAALDSAAGMGA